MKFISGMFGHRRAPAAEAPAPPKPEPLSPGAVMRLRREREEAERAERRREEGVEMIRRACEGPLRHWWPGMPASGGRLSGRATLPERFAERVRDVFTAFRRGY